jgi:hypothetical protein
LLGLHLAALGYVGQRIYAGHFSPARPEQQVDAGPSAIEAPARLTVDRRIAAGSAPFAAQRIRARVRFDSPGAVEFVFRQPEPDKARQLAFVLSSRPELPSTFTAASSVEFELGSRGDGFVCPLQRPVAIEILAEGPRLIARADGELIARSWDSEMLAGLTSAQGICGTAELLEFSVEPLPWPEGAGRERELALLVAVAVIAAGILLWLEVEILRAAARVPRAIALVRADVVVLPLTAYAVLAAWQGTSHLLQFLVAIVLFFLLQAWFLIRGKRIAPLLLGMAHATLVAVLLGTYIAPRLLETDLERANTLTHYHWSGSRLPSDLLWYLHPLCRRWNEFLANRTFRSRTVCLRKESRGEARALPRHLEHLRSWLHGRGARGLSGAALGDARGRGRGPSDRGDQRGRAGLHGSTTAPVLPRRAVPVPARCPGAEPRVQRRRVAESGRRAVLLPPHHRTRPRGLVPRATAGALQHALAPARLPRESRAVRRRARGGDQARGGRAQRAAAVRPVARRLSERVPGPGHQAAPRSRSRCDHRSTWWRTCTRP